MENKNRSNFGKTTTVAMTIMIMMTTMIMMTIMIMMTMMIAIKTSFEMLLAVYI